MLSKSALEIAGLALVLAVGLAAAAQAGEKTYGVYEYVVENVEGSFEDVSSALETAAESAGWQVLAAIDAGVPEGCSHSARVFVLYMPSYAEEVVGANRRTGPYAALDRVNLFTDENGTHVSVVNPHSITRTVLMDDTSYEDLAEAHLKALREMILSAVKGTESGRQYGQMRDEGHIGKTMGVVAGGRFEDLIQEKASVDGADYAAVGRDVFAGLGKEGKKWGMRAVCQVDMPEFNLLLIGTTGTPMDSKSFDIVKAGSDGARKEFECPGLAHAAAYPIEVVVMEHDGTVKVYMVDAMFRMKMYFEDAGKWAFMNNMKMPGSIDKELKKQFKAGLED
jgi:uncharacterized protein (DUF302 family)